MHKNSNNFILNYTVLLSLPWNFFEISPVQVANDGLMVCIVAIFANLFHTQKKSYTHLPIRTILSIDFDRLQTTWQKYSQYNSNVNIQYALKRWDNWTCVLFENKNESEVPVKHAKFLLMYFFRCESTVCILMWIKLTHQRLFIWISIEDEPNHWTHLTVQSEFKENTFISLKKKIHLEKW